MIKATYELAETDCANMIKKMGNKTSICRPKGVRLEAALVCDQVIRMNGPAKCKVSRDFIYLECISEFQFSALMFTRLDGWS